MSKFSVNPKVLKGVVSKEEDLSSKIEGLARDLDSVRRNLSLKGQSGSTVKSKLGNLVSNIRSSSRDMRTVSRVLDRAVDEYVRTEDRLSGKSAGRAMNLRNPAGDTVSAWSNKGNTSDPDWRKMWLDILGGAGYLGGLLSAPIALQKQWYKNEGTDISIGDIGKLIKGAGKSELTIIDLMNKYYDNNRVIDAFKFLGLDNYRQTIAPYGDLPEAAWASLKGLDTFKASLKEQLSIFDNAGKLRGTKIAGWALSLISNGFQNVDEYGSLTNRAVQETVSETLIDIGKTALTTAAITAGAAAIGVAAPAVVVAGIGAAAWFGIDYLCEKYTGKESTELISDGVLDFMEDPDTTTSKAVETVKNFAKTAGNSVAGWLSKIGPSYSISMA